MNSKMEDAEQTVGMGSARVPKKIAIDFTLLHELQSVEEDLTPKMRNKIFLEKAITILRTKLEVAFIIEPDGKYSDAEILAIAENT